MPMAQAMKSTLLTGEGVKREYTLHHHQQFGINKTLKWALRASPGRKQIPPHITRTIQGIGTALIEVRQVWRAAVGEELCKEVGDGTNACLARRPSNLRFKEREHIV